MAWGGWLQAYLLSQVQILQKLQRVCRLVLLALRLHQHLQHTSSSLASEASSSGRCAAFRELQQQACGAMQAEAVLIW